MREAMRKVLSALECVWWALAHMERAAMESERMKRRCPSCGYEKPSYGRMGPG